MARADDGLSAGRSVPLPFLVVRATAGTFPPPAARPARSNLQVPAGPDGSERGSREGPAHRYRAVRWRAVANARLHLCTFGCVARGETEAFVCSYDACRALQCVLTWHCRRYAGGDRERRKVKKDQREERRWKENVKEPIHVDARALCGTATYAPGGRSVPRSVWCRVRVRRAALCAGP